MTSLLADADISRSKAGRLLPWISEYLEKNVVHRSCTHSLLASLTLAIATYPAALWANIPLEYIHSFNIGYFFGWFPDTFTKSGVQLLYPIPVYCVIPGNRNFRIRTGGGWEVALFVVLIALICIKFNITTNGSIIRQFNQMIGSTAGVEQLYNEKGYDHLIFAHIKGVRKSDRAPVKGDFWIIQEHGQGFIVQDANRRIYKVGTEPDVQIITQHVTADPGPVTTTSMKAVRLNKEEIAAVLKRFDRPNEMVFISGQIAIKHPEELQNLPDPYQFPIFVVTDANIILETAPLEVVTQVFGSQVATGQLTIRSIYVQKGDSVLPSPPTGFRAENLDTQLGLTHKKRSFYVPSDR